MKNYFLIALLTLGLFATNTLTAQDIYGRKAEKKEWKMHKKESKIGQKMFRDRPGKAAKKKFKARKKAYKMEAKEDMYR